MQRMGGGSRKAKRGGGNDPRCGCDMRVGWPADLKAQGGGGCGLTPLMRGGGCGCGGNAPLFPQGGGGCACSGTAPLFPQGGGKRGRRGKRKTRKGAGLLFANGGGQCCPGQVLRFGHQNGGSLCGDFGCPFKGTGYCDFYAKGGAWGNDHYGEPVSIQAKLRGGANVSINDIEDLIQDYRSFLNEYTQLPAGEIVDKGRYEQMYADFDELAAKFKILDDQLDGPLSPELQEKKEELYGLEAAAEERDQQYYNASGLANNNANEQGGGYKPSKRNLKYLRRYKQGKSIGFTMRSSLKAKGLIPRTSRKNRGKKIVSAKYK